MPRPGESVFRRRPNDDSGTGQGHCLQPAGSRIQLGRIVLGPSLAEANTPVSPRDIMDGRQSEPEQPLGDAEDGCPMDQFVEVLDLRPVLHPADLGLGHVGPAADDILRYGPRVVWVVPVCRDDLAHVPRAQSVQHGRDGPEFVGKVGRLAEIDWARRRTSRAGGPFV
jgi:hypothetical protein